MRDKQQLLEEALPKSQKQHFQLSASDCQQLKQLSIIQKYNLFIKCYNISCNRIDERTLTYINKTKLFNSFHHYFIKRKLTVLLFTALLIPIINLFFLIYLVLVISQYSKGLKVYRKNQRKIKDPFKNMKFDPLKCSQLKRNFHLFTISFKNLNTQFNLKQNVQLTSSQGKSGNKSQWMIYNGQFASYYNGFLKWKLRFTLILVTAVCVAIASNILLIIML